MKRVFQFTKADKLGAQELSTRAATREAIQREGGLVLEDTATDLPDSLVDTEGFIRPLEMVGSHQIPIIRRTDSFGRFNDGELAVFPPWTTKRLVDERCAVPKGEDRKTYFPEPDHSPVTVKLLRSYKTNETLFGTGECVAFGKDEAERLVARKIATFDLTPDPVVVPPPSPLLALARRKAASFLERLSDDDCSR
jgi:hypothetical protein